MTSFIIVYRAKHNWIYIYLSCDCEAENVVFDNSLFNYSRLLLCCSFVCIFLLEIYVCRINDKYPKLNIQN